jgi:hypothetical protein
MTETTDEIYSPRQLSRLLGLSMTTVYGYLRLGIPHIKVKRRILISRHRFEEWLNENTTTSPNKEEQKYGTH